MKKIFAILSALILCAVSFASGPKMYIIDSKFMHFNDTVMVWSPAGLEHKKDVKTVILLHGAGGNVHTWSNYADLQALSDKHGFRLVCFDGLKGSWYLNNADKSKPQVRDFFWKELWPLLNSKYTLRPETTFIAGLSMGGHGAMNIFFDNPTLFTGAASMGGVLDLSVSVGASKVVPGILGKEDIRSKTVLDSFATNRIDRLIDILGRKKACEKLLSISCGSDDRLITCSERFAGRCHDLGLKYFYFVGPGRHKRAFWRWSLDKNLQLFNEYLAGDSFGIDPKLEPAD